MNILARGTRPLRRHPTTIRTGISILMRAMVTVTERTGVTTAVNIKALISSRSNEASRGTLTITITITVND